MPVVQQFVLAAQLQVDRLFRMASEISSSVRSSALDEKRNAFLSYTAGFVEDDDRLAEPKHGSLLKDHSIARKSRT